MTDRILSLSDTQPYGLLWNKYRPVILKLMIAAKEAPQQYKLFSHEFRTHNPKDKKGLSFTLRAHKGIALNNIKSSVIAQDLLIMLTRSQKASELMNESIFEFTLNRDCRLDIRINETL